MLDRYSANDLAKKLDRGVSQVNRIRAGTSHPIEAAYRDLTDLA